MGSTVYPPTNPLHPTTEGDPEEEGTKTLDCKPTEKRVRKTFSVYVPVMVEVWFTVQQWREKVPLSVMSQEDHL